LWCFEKNIRWWYCYEASKLGTSLLLILPGSRQSWILAEATQAEGPGAINSLWDRIREVPRQEASHLAFYQGPQEVLGNLLLTPRVLLTQNRQRGLGTLALAPMGPWGSPYWAVLLRTVSQKHTRLTCSHVSVETKGDFFGAGGCFIQL
jgi:hypothetical protein